MKFSKKMLKVISIITLSATLYSTYSTTALATDVQVPILTQATVEYANIYSKAKIFNELSIYVADRFTSQCIKEKTLDKAIEAAKEASEKITTLKFIYTETPTKATTPPILINTRVPESGFFTEEGVNKVSLVRFEGSSLDTYNKIENLLSDASVGDIKLNINTDKANKFVDNASFKAPDSFSDLFFVVNDKQIGYNTKYYIIKIGTKLDPSFDTIKSSLDGVSKFLSDYASFLQSLKAYYKAAGCSTIVYDTDDNTTSKSSNKTTADADSSESGTDTTTKNDSSKKDAVITAKNKSVKLNSSFNFMKGVKAADNGGKGNDITKKVTVSGTVNTSKEGTYKLTYKVTGTNGKTVSKTIEITVGK